MRRGYTKVEFNSHELSEKAWAVYSQTQDDAFVWLKKYNYDNDCYEYYQWYKNDIYERVGTIDDVNRSFESEYDEYWDNDIWKVGD